MFGLSRSQLTSALCATLSLISQRASAAPVSSLADASSIGARDSTYWLGDSSITKGSAYGGADGYQVFRDVTAYGAKGDGVTDDSDAINKAFSDGNRCGLGCNQSTTSPAIIYFPSGKYYIQNAILMDYYSQMIGDANDPPTIIGGNNFSGMALIDADPYGEGGVNWFTNQNNFFRQVRNFVLDMTQMGNAGAGIHWQVAQATSLQNIVFNMGTGDENAQNGIFMDNGSGGFMSDLTFNGGNIGAFLGSQQFTSRNLVFNNCKTAIFMNWNWGWTLHNITVTGGTTALNMSNSPTNQTVGSVVLADSTFTGVQYGVVSAYKTGGNVPTSGGTLVLDNVDLSGTKVGVASYEGATIVAPGKVSAWASGNGYTRTSQATAVQGNIEAPTKATSLLTNGNIFGRSKPQYESLPLTSFLSVQSYGAKGDGVSDDTNAINTALKVAAAASQVAYFPSGAYLVSSTIKVPSGSKVVGILWPMILASGSNFSDASNPQAVFQVGQVGETGTVEISDMLFGIKGPNPGAIMVEWNLQCSSQGACGMWDSHVRMGGSYGSELQLSQCLKDPSQTVADTNCIAGFLMFYSSPKASGIYLENTWFWTADHDMEDPAQSQISVYNARGVLIESVGPVWLWGTASEHSVIYNYQFNGVQALFSGLMQTETPYMQPNPLVPEPFTFNSQYDDPTFTICTNSNGGEVPCKDAWGLRVYNSKNILIYSTGFYSFFNNYDQQCVIDENCQEFMIRIQNSQVNMYAVTTKAAVNMIADDSAIGYVLGADNRGVYGDTLAYYFTG